VSPLLTLLSFALRVSFGLAVAMAVTPPRWVGSGFYRIHLWVLLGVFTLAALVVLSLGGAIDTGGGSASAANGDSAVAESAAIAAPVRDSELSESGDAPLVRRSTVLLSLAIAGAALSYVGSVVWLYEKAAIGRASIIVVAAIALAAALLLPDASGRISAFALLPVLDVVSSGLLAGVTLAAMLLGHWYLNAPNMQLAPLKRLIALAIALVLVRGAVSGTDLAVELASAATPIAQLGLTWWLLVALRWIAGIALTLVLAVLAWQTLKIPNTQSATGILYAAVATCFLGELTAMLLAAG